jgi:hypothetical protein
MHRVAPMGLVILASLATAGARAEERAILVEIDGASWSQEETARLVGRLQSAGITVVEPPVARASRSEEVDEDRFRDRSKRGLVALARGRFDEADVLLAEALDGLSDPIPPRLLDEAMASCLDRAEVARARGGATEATEHVRACRRRFPFVSIDRRRTPPEIVERVRLVEDERVALHIEPRGRACQVFVEGDDAPLHEVSALPGVETELVFVCDDGASRSRRVRFDEGVVVDVTLTLEDRLHEGPPMRLRTQDPRADAQALRARLGETVFLLTRDDAGLLVLRADATGVTAYPEDRLGGIVDTAPQKPARTAGSMLRRASSWVFGVAGAAAYSAALAPMRDRARAIDATAGLAYEDPSFLTLRDEFDAARPALRRLAVIGGLSASLGGALSVRPIPRPWAISSAALGVVFLAAGATLVARAPACDPGQATFAGCLEREVQRDRGLLVMMASAPLFSVSSRSFLAKGRGISLHASARSVHVSFYLSAPPGPRPRDGVWFHTKE